MFLTSVVVVRPIPRDLSDFWPESCGSESDLSSSSKLTVDAIESISTDDHPRAVRMCVSGLPSPPKLQPTDLAKEYGVLVGTLNM